MNCDEEREKGRLKGKDECLEVGSCEQCEEG